MTHPRSASLLPSARRALAAAALLTLPALLAASGCSSSDVSLGKDDSASKKGEPCGPVTCAIGQECCNASCGICTEPGGSCIALACTDGGMGTYEPCEGLACGDPCSPCAPDDASCVAPEVVHSCSRAGECRPGPADCGGPGGERCGTAVCAQGEVCCNASCGICTPPGGSCIELACETDCRAMDAESGPTDCLTHLGYAWNGLECAPVTCTCEGAECDRLYDDLAECQSTYSACPEPPSCGGFTGQPCADGLECTDDPRDDCDPAAGGADCPGICVRGRRVVTEACAKVRDDACKSDADCVGGGCGGELCHNPALGTGVSDCECVAPAAACGCVAGKCAWFR